MNRIARTFAALLLAAGVSTAVVAHAQAQDSVVAGNHWCC